MINMVKDITQKDIPYNIVERRSGDVAVSLANPDKAKTIL
jgi:UDP-glucose 4-epimerase